MAAITGSAAHISTASGTISSIISLLRQTEIDISFEADEFDVAELAGSYDGAGAERLSGLKSGILSFTGLFPKAATKVGNAGSVTSGAVANFLTEWSLDIDFGEQEITAFGDTTFKKYIASGLYVWSGSYTAIAEGAVATPVTAANSLGASATFDTGQSLSFAGKIINKSMSHAIKKADKQMLSFSYQGSGTLTGTGFTVPSAAPSEADTFTLDTGPSNYTGTGFLKSLSLRCSVNNPITVSGTVRICGS